MPDLQRGKAESDDGPWIENVATGERRHVRAAGESYTIQEHLERPSYIRFCATCDHPEGDHTGQAGWHGPRRGHCWRDHCGCQGFTLEGETPAADEQHTALVAERNRYREALERIADGDVPNVRFDEGDLISAFAQEALGV